MKYNFGVNSIYFIIKRKIVISNLTKRSEVDILRWEKGIGVDYTSEPNFHFC